ncbi:MAG: low molecular weight protein-tyrosine-phosphatase [Candidatus Nanopelagicales bacterium]
MCDTRGVPPASVWTTWAQLGVTQGDTGLELRRYDRMAVCKRNLPDEFPVTAAHRGDGPEGVPWHTMAVMTPSGAKLSTDRTISVTMVCTGNICRSPMAEAILRSTLAGTDLADRVVVDSAGTHDYHVGQDADRRARQVLAEGGYDIAHQARQFDPDWLTTNDLILAMDAGHLHRLHALADQHGITRTRIRIRSFRDFDPEGPGDVPDPYYDTLDAYRLVRTMVQRSMPALTDHLRAMLHESGTGQR